uniref:Uncharacterized protein n=1 Tax=viral metagenome TaxID=1070528 RepID=A0A6M3KED4_9ZZZZ
MEGNQMEQELYVWDTELTISGGKYYGPHTKTERKPRLSDGVRHPVHIVQPAKKVVKDERR